MVIHIAGPHDAKSDYVQLGDRFSIVAHQPYGGKTIGQDSLQFFLWCSDPFRLHVIATRAYTRIAAYLRLEYLHNTNLMPKLQIQV